MRKFNDKNMKSNYFYTIISLVVTQNRQSDNHA